MYARSPPATVYLPVRCGLLYSLQTSMNRGPYT